VERGGRHDRGPEFLPPSEETGSKSGRDERKARGSHWSERGENDFSGAALQTRLKKKGAN